ncbi:MAG: hypothetical protein HY561_01985 [Gemmatimonadetes bacterium]|nr:hypothetical protein [Gemmatimonadota bacterium]
MKDRGQTAQAVALVLLFLGVTVLTILGFLSRPWLPPAASAHGPGVDGMIRYLLFTTGAIFVTGHVVLAGYVWRYARGKRTRAPRTDPRVERWWSVVPVIAMAGIAEVGVLVIGLPVWAEVYAVAQDDFLDATNFDGHLLGVAIQYLPNASLYLWTLWSAQRDRGTFQKRFRLDLNSSWSL